jgi:hypothetical protein
MYKEKYIKYKTKYTALKNQLGGTEFSFLKQGETVPYYEKINYVKKKFSEFEEIFYIIYYSHNEIKLVRILFKKDDKANVYYEVEVPSLHLSYENEQFIITLFIPTISDSMKYWVIKLTSIDDIKILYDNIIKQLNWSDQRNTCKEILKYLELIKLIMSNRQDNEMNHVKKLITLLDSFMEKFTMLVSEIDYKPLPDINKEKEEAIKKYDLIVDKDIMPVEEYSLIQEKRIPFKDKDKDKLKETYKEISSPKDRDKITKYREENLEYQKLLEQQRKNQELLEQQRKNKDRIKKERQEDGELEDNNYS